MAKQVKELKEHFARYSVNLDVTDQKLDDLGFGYIPFRGKHSFIKVYPLKDNITVTIMIVLDYVDEQLIGHFDLTYMESIRVGNPILDDTPPSVVSFIKEELDNLVSMDVLIYTEPKKKGKKN